jgi:hypothetical protein
LLLTYGRSIIEIFGIRFAVARYCALLDNSFSVLPDVTAAIVGQDRIRNDAEFLNKQPDQEMQDRLKAVAGSHDQVNATSSIQRKTKADTNAGHSRCARG